MCIMSSYDYEKQWFSTFLTYFQIQYAMKYECLIQKYTIKIEYLFYKNK